MTVFSLFSAPVRRWLLVLPLAATAACSSGGGTGSDPEAAATAQNEQKIQEADVTDKQKADAQFLVQAAGNALLGVELGKLVQARATLPALRTYGARLVQGRLALLADLRALAQAKSLALPPALSDDAQEAYHDASTQTGTRLDKQAVELILKIQRQDEDAFDDMKDDAYDGDIRGFAAKHYSTVKEQLDATKEVADAVDNQP